MRINGYNPANRMTGPGSRTQSIHDRPTINSGEGIEGPALAPRLMPVESTQPSGPDMRFLAQLVGQMSDEGESKVSAIRAYDRPADDQAERPYWAKRPVRFLI
ncbi:MAG: hypothetical protein U1E97_09535 [Alphaproteobacteria bacterium]